MHQLCYVNWAGYVEGDMNTVNYYMAEHMRRRSTHRDYAGLSAEDW